MSVANKMQSELTIVIDAFALDLLLKHIQLPENDEACGILIGTHEIDGTLINVCFATEPGIEDERGKYFYRIKSIAHKNVLQERFRISKNREVYLGTWHTHPEDDPTPSSCDVKDWMKQYKANRHLFNVMIFAIVGRRNIRWHSISGDSLNEITRTHIIYRRKE